MGVSHRRKITHMKSSVYSDTSIIQVSTLRQDIWFHCIYN